MRKHNVIFGVICVVAVVVALFLKMRPRTVPYEQCSEVYKQYCNVEGVRATYIQDFRVNDTLTVGVTLLEATDSAGWDKLSQDFEVPDLRKEDEQNVLENSTVGFKKMRPLLPRDNKEEWLTTYSREKRSICVFHILDNAQYLAIIMYSLDEIAESE